MTHDTQPKLQVIGHVQSSIKIRKGAPKMETAEGAVAATIHINALYQDALLGIHVGQQILLFTWLHQANREVLQCHPKGDQTRAIKGVFATRSPDRPNPIGLHQVTVTSITENALQIEFLEALDQTPIIDIKPLRAHKELHSK